MAEQPFQEQRVVAHGVEAGGIVLDAMSLVDDQMAEGRQDQVRPALFVFPGVMLDPGVAEQQGVIGDHDIGLLRLCFRLIEEALVDVGAGSGGTEVLVGTDA